MRLPGPQEAQGDTGMSLAHSPCPSQPSPQWPARPNQVLDEAVDTQLLPPSAFPGPCPGPTPSRYSTASDWESGVLLLVVNFG